MIVAKPIKSTNEALKAKSYCQTWAKGKNILVSAPPCEFASPPTVLDGFRHFLFQETFRKKETFPPEKTEKSEIPPLKPLTVHTSDCCFCSLHPIIISYYFFSAVLDIRQI